jgi:hypothetical protein
MLNNLDLAVFLVAGILGAFSAYRPDGVRWGGSIAWVIIALWALLKLLKVL